MFFVLVSCTLSFDCCFNCSRFDFNKEPAFSWINKLSAEAERAIKQSKVLFCNGFAFDEFSPGLIVSALELARDAGTAIFFDPGPRNKSLLHGTPEQQAILQRILSISDVLLLTADEVKKSISSGKMNLPYFKFVC